MRLRLCDNAGEVRSGRVIEVGEIVPRPNMKSKALSIASIFSCGLGSALSHPPHDAAQYMLNFGFCTILPRFCLRCSAKAKVKTHPLSSYSLMPRGMEGLSDITGHSNPLAISCTVNAGTLCCCHKSPALSTLYMAEIHHRIVDKLFSTAVQQWNARQSTPACVTSRCAEQGIS